MDAHFLTKDAFWADESSLLLQANGLEIMPENPESSVVFATSGSTGKPRFFALSKRALLVSAHAVNQHLEVDSASVWGLCLPWWHVGGFGVLARAFAAHSAHAVYPGKWNPQEAWAWLQRERVTHLSLVPTQLHDLVQAGCSAPPALRAVVIGGGKLADDLAVRARALHWPILASYGMTEAGSQIATHLPGAESEGLKLLPCWRARTTPDGGIEIAGEALFHGQWFAQNDDWRYEARVGEWYATQDMGEVVGTHLRIHHRSDSLVKVLGELVNPLAIEESMVELGLPLGRIVVLALPEARRQHELVLVHENLDRALIGRVVDAYHQSCPGFAKMSFVHGVSSFPRSDLGKIQRQALRESVIVARATRKSSLAPEG
jgi:O-succinylbenzoic acid--CoA ligase